MTNSAFLSSDDLGETWSVLSRYPSRAQILVDWSNNDIIYTFYLPQRSENGGRNWKPIYNGIRLPMYWVTTIIDPFDSSVLYMSTREGIYTTTNRGNLWTLMEGSENLEIISSDGDQYDNLFIDSTTQKLYIGTTQGLYQYDLLVSIEDEKENIPNDFVLYQNYPNPFNPTTVIGYQLPAGGFVKLTIYDQLGREITTLVNKVQNAGSYKINFNGSSLASGIYFYKLTSGAVSFTRKMLLLK
jgi:hypothetical protein